MYQRKGTGGASASSTKVAKTTAVSDDNRHHDYDEKCYKLATEAVNSIQTCYKLCFVAVFADVITTIIDGNIWSKFFNTNDDNDYGGDYHGTNTNTSSPSLSWVDYVDLCDSLVHFAFGCGLWHISQFYSLLASSSSKSKDKSNDNRKRTTTLTTTTGGSSSTPRRLIKDEHFTALLRTTAIVWGILAVNYAFVAVSMAAALPTHVRNGRDGNVSSSNDPLHFLLEEVSSSKATLTATVILVSGCIATNAYCKTNAISQDRADDGRISMHQQKSKKNVVFYASNRRLGYRAYRNQALCVWSFGLTAVMELLKWMADATTTTTNDDDHDDDAGNGRGIVACIIVGRLLSVSDVIGPFVIAWLLFGLNKNFLRAVIVRLRDDYGSEIITLDEEIYNDLFIAQMGFYKKVSEAMKDATIFRLLPYIARPIGAKLLVVLEEVAPSVAMKIVQLLEFFT